MSLLVSEVGSILFFLAFALFSCDESCPFEKTIYFKLSQDMPYIWLKCIKPQLRGQAISKYSNHSAFNSNLPEIF